MIEILVFNEYVDAISLLKQYTSYLQSHEFSTVAEIETLTDSMCYLIKQIKIFEIKQIIYN